MMIRESQNGYKLKIKIPFISKSDFKLQLFGDKLIINIHNRRKTMFLPKFVYFLKLTDYSYSEPWLEVSLTKK